MLLRYCSLLACGLLVACSSSSRPENRIKLRFGTPTALTVFGTGALEFELSRALEASEQLRCSIEGQPANCTSDDVSAELTYENVEPGPHRVEFVIQSEQGEEVGRSEYILEVVKPTVVVFAATPGGITAAIAAARAGLTVALLEPTRWVGGMASAGLSATDIGVRGVEVISGLAKEVFDRAREAENMTGVCPDGCGYSFEPHVVEQTFERMLAEASVIVERDVQLDGVQKDGANIVTISTSRGKVGGEIFIDASYEGDLMALSGISFRLGREPQRLADPPDDPEQLALQEDFAGVRGYRAPYGLRVDPYVVPEDPGSGTLPFVEPHPMPIPSVGEGDGRVMAYTYRLCVTDDPSNRIPFESPEDYDPASYEGSTRVAEALAERRPLDEAMFNPARIVRSRDPAYFKYDLNGGSTFSIDMTAPDLNQAYVEANEQTRERIRQAYRNYTLGLLYTWQTNPRFGPLNVKVARFGLCADEFVDRGGWPHRIYVRVARRMVGEYVMNENDVMQNGRRPAIDDVIGFGAYNIDMHSYRYFAAPLDWPDGTNRDAIVFEGFLIEHPPEDAPYPVSYRALTPRAGEATNFLNPVTLSATNVAYSALRMEPTFMILGQAAGTAAALAVETQQNVQAIDYRMLRQRLLAGGVRLSN